MYLLFLLRSYRPRSRTQSPPHGADPAVSQRAPETAAAGQIADGPARHLEAPAVLGREQPEGRRVTAPLHNYDFNDENYIDKNKQMRHDKINGFLKIAIVLVHVQHTPCNDSTAAASTSSRGDQHGKVGGHDAGAHAMGADLKRYNHDITGRMPEGQQSVTDIGSTIQSIDSKVENLYNRVADMENWKQEIATDMQKWKEETLQEAKQAATAAASTATGITRTAPRIYSSSAAATSSSRSSWRPRIVHIRGFAPYGSAEPEQLSKEACIAVQKELGEMMGIQCKETTTWLQPFNRNQAVRFECLDANDNQCKAWSDNLNKNINQARWKIKEKEVKGAVETSPSRRTAVRAFFDARDDLRALNKNEVFQECRRALELWDRTAMIRIGYYNKTPRLGIGTSPPL